MAIYLVVTRLSVGGSGYLFSCDTPVRRRQRLFEHLAQFHVAACGAEHTGEDATASLLAPASVRHDEEPMTHFLYV